MNSVNPFDLLLFGATGDLATRKLIPALYHRQSAGQLPGDGRIIAMGRQDLSGDGYLDLLHEKSRVHIVPEMFNEQDWSLLTDRIEYLKVEASSQEDFAALKEYLPNDDRVRVFYLSTAPELFAEICKRLAAAGLVTAQSRVVLEKPLGHDLMSSDVINSEVESVFEENQIYRIDHYLGKEAVQNLMALRFGNSIFEPLWSHGKIRDVQITVAEQIGVEGRGEFYDSTGTLRDMVQNHLLQLLCILAMEPPISMDANNVRNEKLKVLHSLKPFSPQDVITDTVRGQYRAGAVNGKVVPGYLEEPGINPVSTTETFVALRAQINNWRWAGVPFFLRTGKRMHGRLSEIIISFYSMPHAIYPTVTGKSIPNRLVIRLQPEESVELHLLAKKPGEENVLKPVKLDLNLADTADVRHLEAYERLLMDVIKGNQTLFVRRDELDTAWRWVEPILDAWEASGEAPKGYVSGTPGPFAASSLVAREGISWIEET